LRAPGETEIEHAVAQFRDVCETIERLDVQHGVGMVPGEPMDDQRKRRGGDRLVAHDAQLADRRVREEFDVSDTLLELVKRNLAALEQSRGVHGGLHALRASVEQLDPERMLEIRNHLGNGRRGHVELRRGSRHAAAFRDGEEHVQVAQLEPPAQLPLPVDLPSHKENTFVALGRKGIPPITQAGLTLQSVGRAARNSRGIEPTTPRVR
jgi:hypothetical protein